MGNYNFRIAIVNDNYLQQFSKHVFLKIITFI